MTDIIQKISYAIESQFPSIYQEEGGELIAFVKAYYEFLEETGRPIVCVGCSVEQKAVGFMDWGHKTAPSLVMVPANATETIRKLDRANRRAR